MSNDNYDAQSERIEDLAYECASGLMHACTDRLSPTHGVLHARLLAEALAETARVYERLSGILHEFAGEEFWERIKAMIDEDRGEWMDEGREVFRKIHAPTPDAEMN